MPFTFDLKKRARESASKARALLRFKPLLHALRVAAVCFFLSTIGVVVAYRFVPPPLTPLMALRCVGHVADGHWPKLSKDWEPLEDISPRLVEAIVAAEDQEFFSHSGFDFDAILSAFTINLEGSRKLGASTISQQTAKNVFLWPDRSWTRKALEAYFTVLIEAFWSKRRILEVYVNVVEMGDGVYGAEAAARKYYGTTAENLGRERSAMLAAVLPNPRKWSPDKPTPYLLRRQAWILRQMTLGGPLPDGLSRLD